MKPKIVVFILCVAVGSWTFKHYGRSLWYPLFVKAQGAKTTEQVVEKIEANVLKRLELSDEEADDLQALVILAMKEEKRLEVWGYVGTEGLQLLKSYPFTGSSGTLGPKLREGDGQIPEGIYRVEHLNPNSSYHLSMKLDYPNAFDQAKGLADGRSQLGFDIFIHGNEVTVGCIPLGDEAIEELFFLVYRVGVERVRVILSPYDMREGTKAVDVPAIDWEDELYAAIRAEITALWPTKILHRPVGAPRP